MSAQQPPKVKELGSDAEPASSVKRRKASCNHCRQRKSKCDGKIPNCSTCVAYKTTCRYEKPPSLAYVRSLEAKVEGLTRELSVARSMGRSPEIYNPRDNGGEAEYSTPRHLSSMDESDEIALRPSLAEESSMWANSLSTDGRGGVSYHNPTSAIHEAPPSEVGSSPGLSIASSLKPGETVVPERPSHTSEVRQVLVSNAANQRQLESLNMTMYGPLPRDVATELLKLHWCWVHPVFLFVYRPAFTRDMAAATTGITHTPYYSDTLLAVLYAHTARFLVKSSASHSAAQYIATLAENAEVSLGRRMSDQSSIPTVQALLQQSAREVTRGRSSQAWLYSGMAFRMAIDLGIHLPSDKLQSFVKSLSVEDIEIRKRLFWSCYTWDKAISLYLGRMPCFLGPIPQGDIVFMDDYTETELWEPFYAFESPATTPHYPPVEGRIISTFTGLCKLSIILSHVMLDIYGSYPGINEQEANSPSQGPSISAKGRSFLRICNELREWWSILPLNLQLVVGNLPALSPPPHIVSLNLLYHTTLILLHRPFVIGASDLNSPAVQRSYDICLTATSAIHDLLSLQIATFGYYHVTYLNPYSAYIAATIAILHYQIELDADIPIARPNRGDKLGLKFFLGVLQTTARTMPGLNRSVDIIKRHMQTVLERQTKKQLASLFPDSMVDNANDMHSFQSSQQTYATPTIGIGAQILPPAGMTQDGYGYQAGLSIFGEEDLPAFPGQQFGMGRDFHFDGSIVDPEARAALLDQHLDPHMTLHHESDDWESSYYVNGGLG